MLDFGLQIRYMADEEFALTIRMLAALAFVPPNDVIDSFDTLADYSRNRYGQELDDILDYFEDSYIGRFRHNAPRRRPTLMRLKDGIVVSNRILRLTIHHFGNSSIL